ncbi:MAG: hypothetical protein CMH04_00985 [Marinovum sp.]|nr:hypothetical protein [Marinovum sp.]
MNCITNLYRIGVLLSLCLFSKLEATAQEHWPLIGEGINLDFSTTEVNKIGYDPAYYDVFKAAGFESVRFFVKQGVDPMSYREAIDGAIKRGLTVVITGFTGRTKGKESFVAYWNSFAELYQMYPKELVFEIMNEPKMAGHPNEHKYDVEVMQWLGEAIVAIRATSPKRVIAIGGTHNNHADMLLKYVTPEYLTYKLPDGTGFVEDENIWGIFHNYRPQHWTHSFVTKPIKEANPKWKEEILEALEWGYEWGKIHMKKVVMSEWGSKLTNDRQELLKFIKFMKDECKKRDIDWMYYTGVFNNAWTFSLYTSEYGFEKTADIVEALTGEAPKIMHLPTSQINNSEFTMDREHWFSNGQVTLNHIEGEGVNGSGSLKCMVMFVWPEKPVIYQQTQPDWRFYSEGFYMIQLREGSTYNISFYAKTPVNKTKLRVQLGLAPENKKVLYTSDQVEIDTELTKYEFTYTHKTESVENARFSIIFSERHSEVILDEIKLIGERP